MVDYYIRLINHNGNIIVGKADTIVRARAIAVKQLKERSEFKMGAVFTGRGNVKGTVIKRGRTSNDDWYVILNKTRNIRGNTDCRYAWDSLGSRELFEDGRLGQEIYGVEPVYYR